MVYKQYDVPGPVTEPACVHFRSKALYVIGEIDHKTPEESGSNCWCNLTQHVLGPDSNYVGRRDCIAGRECFRATR